MGPTIATRLAGTDDGGSGGYAAAAAIDPAWIGDYDRWTFAAPFAHLAGRLDLVPEPMLAKLEATKPAAPTRVSVARVGRNEPCPCGSGKKYKRCCIGRTAAPRLP